MNTITIKSTIQNITANRKTISAKTNGSDFGIALQSAFSYSEVKYAWEKHRVVYSSEAQMEMDKLSCYSIADDIATVLRYTYFKEETDDPTKVQALIDGISSRSSQYSMERFEPRWDTTVYRTREEMALFEQQYGACDRDGNEYDDMIDSLLELLDRHFKAEQQREAENEDFGCSSLTVASMAAKIAVSETNEVNAPAM